jgi:hypothetical protein
MTYTLTQELVQAIVHTLNQQPAGTVRPLLNAIEQTCTEQDRAAADKALQDKIDAAINAAQKP